MDLGGEEWISRRYAPSTSFYISVVALDYDIFPHTPRQGCKSHPITSECTLAIAAPDAPLKLFLMV